MKYLAMIDRTADVPPQDIEWTVLQSVREQGLEMPAVQRGWRRDLGTHQEIGLEFFPGSKPVWIWEVK